MKRQKLLLGKVYKDILRRSPKKLMNLGNFCHSGSHVLLHLIFKSTYRLLISLFQFPRPFAHRSSTKMIRQQRKLSSINTNSCKNFWHRAKLSLSTSKNFKFKETPRNSPKILLFGYFIMEFFIKVWTLPVKKSQN